MLMRPPVRERHEADVKRGICVLRSEFVFKRYPYLPYRRLLGSFPEYFKQ
jgi:hypothetical protein